MDILYKLVNLLEGTYTLRILEGFFELFFKIGPYLIISIVINIAAIQYFKGRTINFSSESEILSIIFAALIGLISPLPTYAAIPIGISLMTAGIPFSAILAFIISSPLMNPSIFFLTATRLGMEMAIVRTLAAFLIGTLGGLLSIKIFKSIESIKPAPPDISSKTKKSLIAEVYAHSIYVAKYFSTAILISAAVKALVPPQAITNLLGDNAKMGTLVAIGMGVPFYSCGGAAIPFIETLMDMGMSKGAILAFFIAGPATKLETLYSFHRLLGARVLLFYLTYTLIFSYIAGLLYSFV
jgi:uncharacterized membrane protein YraQ (UPF0718 family)